MKNIIKTETISVAINVRPRLSDATTATAFAVISSAPMLSPPKTLFIYKSSLKMRKMLQSLKYHRQKENGQDFLPIFVELLFFSLTFRTNKKDCKSNDRQ